MKILVYLLLVLNLIRCNTKIDSLSINEISIPNPNDTTFVFLSQDNKLGLHVAVYYNPSLIIKLSSGIFDPDVCWSSNKANIYYMKSNTDLDVFQIWKMKFNGSNKHLITPENISCTSPRISPNGQKLLFTVEINNLYQIIISDTLGNNWHQITDTNIIPNVSEATFYLPSWVPDGENIIFTYHDYIPYQYMPPHLAIMNINSQEVTLFTKIDTLFPHHAKISPKLNELIFVGKGLPGDQLYLINTDQTNLVKLTNSFIVKDCDWSVDGEKIIFSQTTESIDEPYSIWVMNRDGSQKRKIISTEESSCLSPDW